MASWGNLPRKIEMRTEIFKEKTQNSVCTNKVKRVAHKLVNEIQATVR